MFMIQFRPGDYVRIKDTANRSKSGRNNKGQLAIVVRIDMMLLEPYALTNLPDCGGVWFSELEHAGLLDSDLEDV